MVGAHWFGAEASDFALVGVAAEGGGASGAGSVFWRESKADGDEGCEQAYTDHVVAPLRGQYLGKTPLPPITERSLCK